MKKLISTILAGVVFLSTMTALAKEYPQKFWDVPKDHWAFDYVAELVDRGVIAGYEDGSFKPNNTVTRAEWSKIMVCAAGIPTNDNSVYFSDMQEHWAIPYVNAAKNYLTAYSDNTYRPNQAAVREDVTMAMVKLKGYDVSDVDYSYLSNFTDTDSISNNIKAYVAVAVEKGLISGFEDNTFRGQATLTRAEAATLLWKAFQYGSNNKVADTPVRTPTTPEVTVMPTVTPISTPTPTATPVTTPTPRPTPTPEPETIASSENPYVVDTIATVNISTNYTWEYMTSDDNNNLYYYDKNENTIYVIDMDTERVSMYLDISELELREDDLFDYEVGNISTEDDSEIDIVEHYKGFEIIKIYYDRDNNKLLMSGNFRKITDYYGLSDKTTNHTVILDITDNPTLFSNDYSNRVSPGFKIKSGNNLYEFSPSSYGHIMYTMDSVVYNGSLSKFNYSTNEWEVLRSDNNMFGRMGLKGTECYVWNPLTGKVIKCGIDTKLTDIGINTRENVDVLDFKSIPQEGGGAQIFISSNESIFFYDSDNKAIRVIKER